MAEKRRKTTLEQQIDDNLRRVYAEAAQEAVPERLTQLLEQLRRQDAERSAAGNGAADAQDGKPN
jgi:hypothetical protein